MHHSDLYNLFLQITNEKFSHQSHEFGSGLKVAIELFQAPFFDQIKQSSLLLALLDALVCNVIQQNSEGNLYSDEILKLFKCVTELCLDNIENSISKISIDIDFLYLEKLFLLFETLLFQRNLNERKKESINHLKLFTSETVTEFFKNYVVDSKSKDESTSIVHSTLDSEAINIFDFLKTTITDQHFSNVSTTLHSKSSLLMQDYAISSLSYYPRGFEICKSILLFLSQENCTLENNNIQKTKSISSILNFNIRFLKLLSSALSRNGLLYDNRTLIKLYNLLDAFSHAYSLSDDPFFNFDNKSNNQAPAMVDFANQLLECIDSSIDYHVRLNLRAEMAVCMLSSFREAFSLFDLDIQSLSVASDPLILSTLSNKVSPHAIDQFLTLIRDTYHLSTSINAGGHLRKAFHFEPSFDPWAFADEKEKEIVSRLKKPYEHDQFWLHVFPAEVAWLDDLFLLAFLANYSTKQKLVHFYQSNDSSVDESIQEPSSASIDDASFPKQSTPEEDSFFQNLFSEPIKSTGNASTLGQSSEETPAEFALDGSEIFKLATGKSLLLFLNDCIFSPAWNECIFQTSKSLLRSHHVDLLVSMAFLPVRFFPTDPNIQEKKKIAINLTSLPTPLIVFLSASYFLLNNLIMRDLLSIDLETRLSFSLAGWKNEKHSNINDGKAHSEGIQTNDHLLTILSKLLIHFSSRHPSNYPELVLRLWKNYSENLSHLAMSNESIPLAYFSSQLPSQFLAQILFMSFNSLSADHKSVVFQSCLNHLKSICSIQRSISPSDSHSISTANPTLHCLLLSRLVNSIQYMTFHFDELSQSLQLQIRDNVLHQSNLFQNLVKARLLTEKDYFFNFKPKESTIYPSTHSNSIHPYPSARVDSEMHFWKEMLFDFITGDLQSDYFGKAGVFAEELEKFMPLLTQTLDLIASSSKQTSEHWITEQYFYHLCSVFLLQIQECQINSSRNYQERMESKIKPSGPSSIIFRLSLIIRTLGTTYTKEDCSVVVNILISSLKEILESIQKKEINIHSINHFRFNSAIQYSSLLLFSILSSREDSKSSSTSSSSLPQSGLSSNPPSLSSSFIPSNFLGSDSTDSQTFSISKHYPKFTESNLFNWMMTDEQIIESVHLLSFIVQHCFESLQTCIIDVLTEEVNSDKVNLLTSFLLLPDKSKADFYALLQQAGVKTETLDCLRFGNDVEISLCEIFGSFGCSLTHFAPTSNKSMLEKFLQKCISFQNIHSMHVISCFTTISSVLEALEASITRLKKHPDHLFFSSVSSVFPSMRMVSEKDKTSDIIESQATAENASKSLLKILITIENARFFPQFSKLAGSILNEMELNESGITQTCHLSFMRRIKNVLECIHEQENTLSSLYKPVVLECLDSLEIKMNDPLFISFLYNHLEPEGKEEMAFENTKAIIYFLLQILSHTMDESINQRTLFLLNTLLIKCEGKMSDKIKKIFKCAFLDLKPEELAKWIEARLLTAPNKPPFHNNDIPSLSLSPPLPSDIPSLAAFLLLTLANANTSDTFHSPDDFDHHQLFKKVLFDASMKSMFWKYNVNDIPYFLSFLLQFPKNNAMFLHLMSETLKSIDTLQKEYNSVQVSSKKSMEMTTHEDSSTEKHGKKIIDQEKFVGLTSYLLTFLRTLIVSDVHKSKDLISSSDLQSSDTETSKFLSDSKHSTTHPDSLSKDAFTQQNLHNNDNAKSMEDEEDHLSDSELLSLEKDEDEDAGIDDVGHSKALDSQLCTFTSSGSNFMEQHWYFCYTCDLTVSKGCCSVCAAVCHKGHKVVYSRFSRFFCDCGAACSGNGSQMPSSAVHCISLVPRKSSSHTIPEDVHRSASKSLDFGACRLPHSASIARTNDDSDLDDWEVNKDALSPIQSGERLNNLNPSLIQETKSLLWRICQQLLPIFSDKKEDELISDLDFSHGVIAVEKSEMFQLKKSYKPGFIDMKVKTEYSNSRQLKSSLAKGLLKKSIISVSNRGKMAVGEGDKVTIFDMHHFVSQAFISSATTEKLAIKALSKNSVKFEIVHMEFNLSNDSYLAIAGQEDCQIFTLNPRGEVNDRLVIELALEEKEYIRKITWIQKSQVHLAVTTDKFLKIFDLSSDAICPIHCFAVKEDSIHDSVFIPIDNMMNFVILVSNQKGILYQECLKIGDSSSGFSILEKEIETQSHGMHCSSRGYSLFYSLFLNCLILSSENGNYFAHLNLESMTISDVLSIVNENQDVFLPIGIQLWQEIFLGSGMFICQSSNNAYSVHVNQNKLEVQMLKVNGNSSSRVDGVGAHLSSSSESSSLLLLNDDGSVQVFEYLKKNVIPPFEVSSFTWGGQGISNTYVAVNETELNKKLTHLLAKERKKPQIFHVFPFNFFEKTMVVTQDVKIGGDILHFIEADVAKNKLASDEGYLEGPTSSPFNITLFNANKDIVLVGFRVHVGSSSSNHIPSFISVYDRMVPIEAGVKRWYDIPLTRVESLLSDKELSFTIGSTHNNSSFPRIDSLEIYAQSKDDFKWKEKLTVTIGTDLSNGKMKKEMNTPISEDAKDKPIEQLLSTCFSSLQLLYALDGSQSNELSIATDEHVYTESKNQVPNADMFDQILTLFKVDSSFQLKSSARTLLAGLFPSKVAYYQVRDKICLERIMKSLPETISKIKASGRGFYSSVIEFGFCLNSICRIAAKRHFNLIQFFDSSGCNVIDKIMEGLWYVESSSRIDSIALSQLIFSIVDLLYAHMQYLLLKAFQTGSNLQSNTLSDALNPISYHIKAMLFSSNFTIRTSCSMALSSKLLQIPPPKSTPTLTEELTETRSPNANAYMNEENEENNESDSGAKSTAVDEEQSMSSIQYCCDGCSICPIRYQRWHCTVCPDFDLCESCYSNMDPDFLPSPHTSEHEMIAINIDSDINNSQGDRNRNENRESIRRPESEREMERRDNHASRFIDSLRQEEEDEQDEEDEDEDEDEEEEEEEDECEDNENGEENKGDELDEDEEEEEEEEEEEDMGAENWEEAYGSIESMAEEALLELAKEMSMQERSENDEVKNFNEGESAPEIRSTGIEALREEQIYGESPPESSFFAGKSMQSESFRSNLGQDTHANEMEYFEKQSIINLLVGRVLLKHLIRVMDGWMSTVSGSDALPILQLFYRLAMAASAGSGPLYWSNSSMSKELKGGMDSESNLHFQSNSQKSNKFDFDQFDFKPYFGNHMRELCESGMDLVDLVEYMSKELRVFSPLVTVERTKEGEVTVLCFIFFTLLLKNYQNLGSNSQLKTNNDTNSTENVNDIIHQMAEKVCFSLNHSDIFVYILTYVTNLAPLFSKKDLDAPYASTSPALSSNSANCGSLLSIRHDYTSAVFSPFFSNSYAKDRNGDLFFDFHKLLLESSFRLAYYLVKIEKNDHLKELKGSSDADKAQELSGMESLCDVHLTAKLKDWENILCEYINNPNTSFLKRYVRRLLLQSCGSKVAYYVARDSWLFDSEIKKIKVLIETERKPTQQMSYENKLKLLHSLKSMSEIANLRPVNWQKYCSNHSHTLPFLLKSTYSMGEESTMSALKLLTLAFYHENAVIKSKPFILPSNNPPVIDSVVKNPTSAPSAGAGSTPFNVSDAPNYRNALLSSILERVRGRGENGEMIRGSRILESMFSRLNNMDETKQKKEVIVEENTASESYQEVNEDKEWIGMEDQVHVLLGEEEGEGGGEEYKNGGKNLIEFITFFLLEWNSPSIRTQAFAFIQGVWCHGNSKFSSELINCLMSLFPQLPSYGQNIDKFCELLSLVLSKPLPIKSKSASERAKIDQTNNTFPLQSLSDEVLDRCMNVLKEQNELLANHPNSQIYGHLRNLVEFDGYFLESDPCLTCSSPSLSFSKMKLENLKLETKFTENRILVKCTGSHSIQGVVMNIHDVRKSKSVKILNLYYNNRFEMDLSELKNNWGYWKKARTCYLTQGQTELKVDFEIPVVACNFMIELESFYENLQALSMEALQCPRCSRYVTDKYGVCSNCHENAYQCRHCRNINYEHLDAFLCIECGYSKFGRFEFTFSAKTSFIYDPIDNDEDMNRNLSAMETEAENAHKKYQQLLSFKKPLMKLIHSIVQNDSDSNESSSTSSALELQQIVSLPASYNFKINRKIAILGLLYGEKCKSAFDSVSKSVQNLYALRKVIVHYLDKKREEYMHAEENGEDEDSVHPHIPQIHSHRSSNKCFGCASTFISHALQLMQVFAKLPRFKQSILNELFENNIHQGSRSDRSQARALLSAFAWQDKDASDTLNSMIQDKVYYSLNHHRSVDISASVRDEMQSLNDACALTDDCWENRLRTVLSIMFKSIAIGANHPAIAEHIILPCIRIILRFCKSVHSDSNPATLNPTPASGLPTAIDLYKSSMNIVPRKNNNDSLAERKERNSIVSMIQLRRDSERQQNSPENPPENDILLTSYAEWATGGMYEDFSHRKKLLANKNRALWDKIGISEFKKDQITNTHCQSQSQSQSIARDPVRLLLKYWAKWRRKVAYRRMKGMMTLKNEFSMLENGSWVQKLLLSACSQSIRIETCSLITSLASISPSKHYKFLSLLFSLLPSARHAGECASEFFELFNQISSSEESKCFLVIKGFLAKVCELMAEESTAILQQEKSFNSDISQGYYLNQLALLLSEFFKVNRFRQRFVKEGLISQLLNCLLSLRRLIVQKTKLTEDCRQLICSIIENLQEENFQYKKEYMIACIHFLKKPSHKGRQILFAIEQLYNVVCPTKPEPIYQLILTKAPTQEEFIPGSMTKNPYSSAEVGPLMRDVKNKICKQMELLGLLEDDFGMELLVSGNIISLDLPVNKVYELVWKKNQASKTNKTVSSLTDCPPMLIVFRLQGLDGEATEPIIKEFSDEQEEAVDSELELAIASVMADCGGLSVLIDIFDRMDNEAIVKERKEVELILKLLIYCCKLQSNRRSLLSYNALPIFLSRSLHSFSHHADASLSTEVSENLLLIIEILVSEASESDAVDQSMQTDAQTRSKLPKGFGVDAVKMFLEKLSPSEGAGGLKEGMGGGERSGRGKGGGKMGGSVDAVARILPYLTYGEEEAMEVLVDHFLPYLQNWKEFDRLQQLTKCDSKDDVMLQTASERLQGLKNFVRVVEATKQDASGINLRRVILEREIPKCAIQYLKEVFPNTENNTDFKTLPEWEIALSLPSIPIILTFLCGICKGHKETQDCLFKENVLPLLHALEGVVDESDVGARAENILDTLASEDAELYIRQTVESLRETSKEEMRKRALKRRQELLQGMGMKQEAASGGKRIVMMKMAVMEDFELEEEEENALSCMVCREGYHLKPSEVLAAYCFTKRFNLPVMEFSRSEMGYTTVTHFNVIHLQCHLEAKRADASLKMPKKEWEGATIRNSETLCNGLFPLSSSSIPSSQYSRCCDLWWEQLSSSVGRADGSRLHLLLHDIVTMMGRFATNASFSGDSKGGGKESNARLLPFQIQMAVHLLDQAGLASKSYFYNSLTSILMDASALSQREKSPLVSMNAGSPVSRSSPIPSPAPALSSSPSPSRTLFAGSPSSAARTPPFSTSPSTRASFPPSNGQLPYLFVSSLLVLPLEEWQSNRNVFLKHALSSALSFYFKGDKSGNYVLYPNIIPNQSSSSTMAQVRSESESNNNILSKEEMQLWVNDIPQDPSSFQSMSSKLLSALHPMLIFFGMIQKLQDFLKNGGSGKEAEVSSLEGNEAELKPWERNMRRKLWSVNEMIAFADELVEWVEEMNCSCNLMEAMDVAGVLKDALQDYGSCEEFVLHCLI